MSSTFTFHTSSVLKAKKALDVLSIVLAKAQDAPNAADLPAARLYADMLPLTLQVLLACSHANRLVARTTDAEDLPMPRRDLSSFEDMNDIIAATQTLLAQADKDVVNLSAEKSMPFEVAEDRWVEMTVAGIVDDYYLPNIMFHVVTAYAILRKEGVSLGKADYADAFMAKHLG